MEDLIHAHYVKKLCVQEITLQAQQRRVRQVVPEAIEHGSKELSHILSHIVWFDPEYSTAPL